MAARSIVVSRGLGRRLSVVPFDPPLLETFAFITRHNAHLSPASRAFMEVAKRRVTRLAKRLEAEESGLVASRRDAGAAQPA